MKKHRKITIVILIFLALGYILLLLRGNEDTWLCQNGIWTQHGHPSAPMPTEICK